MTKTKKTFEARKHKEALAALEATAGEHGFALGGLMSEANVKPKVAPKFRHPEDAELTWSGRGRKPKWFVKQLEAGVSPDDLAI